MRHRSVGKWLAGFAAAVAVLAALVIVGPHLVPASLIAGRIAAIVHQRTGRELRIAGPISFTLLPSPALVAHGVTLASPPGHFSADFLTVETVDLALKPAPLLHGAIEIEHLRLTRPAVSFEIDPSGARNWIFHPVAAAPSATPAAPSATRQPSFAADNLTVVDGAATYADDRTGARLDAGQVNLTLALPSLSGPLDAAGSLIYREQSVQFDLSLAGPAALRDGETTPAKVKLASPNGNLGFDGVIGARPGRASGALTLDTPSLRQLARWLRPSLAVPDDGFGALTLSGKLDAAAHRVTLADAAAKIDGIAAEGTIALAFADRQASLDLGDLKLAGGTGAARFTVDGRGDVPRFTATGKLTRITVHDLPIGIAGFRTLSGTGDVSFDLAGAGKTLHAVVAALDGSGSMAFVNGSIGAAGLGQSLATALGPAVAAQAVPQNLDFTSLSGSAVIRQGVLTNNDLRLDGPKISATAAGTLDLAARRIDYAWNPDIARLGSAHVAISGGWDDPAYKVLSVTITNPKGLVLPGLKLR